MNISYEIFHEAEVDVERVLYRMKLQITLPQEQCICFID